MSRLPAGAGPVAPAAVHDVRVGRQAIYDGRRRLVSYEVLFRGHQGRAVPGEEYDTPSGETSTSRVIAATFATFGLDVVSDGKPVFINFTRGFLTGLLPIPVEPGNVIIEVTDQVNADRELLLGLAELKQAGYRIAVDNYRGDPGRSVMVELADFVKINIDTLAPAVVPGLVQACRQTAATLVAAGVEDGELLQRCTDLGFELFQGNHLYRPAVLERRVLSPTQLICVRLLHELSQPEPPVARIEQLVGSDPGLVIRLLRSAHSASGAGRAVESLRQALVLVGPQRLRSWIVLTLLEGVATQNASDELWNVLARAYTCAALAAAGPGPGPDAGADAGAGAGAGAGPGAARDADLAYTVGLLAGAALLLGTDARTVADVSGVGAEARAALVDGAGLAGRALRATLAHEAVDDDAVVAAGFSPGDVSRIWMRSLQQSLELVHQILGR